MGKPLEHLDCVRDQGMIILTLKDEQIKDWEPSQAIRDELISCIRDTTAPRVIVDMSQVKFLASCGFLPLVSLNGVVNNANATTTTVIIDGQGRLQYRGRFADEKTAFAEVATQNVLSGQDVPQKEMPQRG